VKRCYVFRIRSEESSSFEAVIAIGVLLAQYDELGVFVEMTSALLFVALDASWVVGVSTDAGAFAFIETAGSEVTEGGSTAGGESPHSGHAFVHTSLVERENRRALVDSA